MFGFDFHILIWPDDFYRKSLIPKVCLDCRLGLIRKPHYKGLAILFQSVLGLEVKTPGWYNFGGRPKEGTLSSDKGANDVLLPKSAGGRGPKTSVIIALALPVWVIKDGQILPKIRLWKDSYSDKSKVVVNTYLSSTGAYFRGRRFPIEIIRPGRYMKIKFKDFGYSISSPGNS